MQWPLLRPAAILTLVLSLLPSQVSSTPYVVMHWQTCSSNAQNRNMGSGPVDEVVVTVTGLSGTVRGIGAALRLQTLFAVLPPAWRFDPDGCEAGHFQASSTPTGPGCPALLGAHAFFISRFDHDAVTMRGHASYYGVFDPFVANPATTYTLARFTFDHSNAIAGFGTTAEACGCLDRPLCLLLDDVSYVDDAGAQIPIAQLNSLSWNDPSNSLGCGGVWCDLGNCPPPPTDSTCVVPVPTAANTRSWGSLKASYR